MGYGFFVLRTDFRKLTEVPGSRNYTLMRQILPHVQESDAEYLSDREEDVGDDEEAGECVLPSQALKRIFDGDIPAEDADVDSAPYVTALLEIYRRLGTEVGHINLSSHDVKLLGDWDVALSAVGIGTSFLALSARGAPFTFPFIEPFPAVGFIRPDEVASAATVIRGGKLPWPLRRPPRPDMHLPTYQMFCGWVNEARIRDQALLGVLS